MHYRTLCALHGPQTLAQEAPSARPMDVAAMIQALIATDQWDSVPEEHKAMALRAGSGDAVSRAGLIWMLGHHDALCAAALEDEPSRAAYRALLAARDPLALDDPVIAALLDDHAPVPLDADSIRRLERISDYTSAALARSITVLAHAIAKTDAPPPAAVHGLRALTRKATAEPMTAARAMIGMHRCGAWTALSASSVAEVRDACLLLSGAVARMPEAAAACMKSGIADTGWDRIIPDAMAAEAVAGLGEHWNRLSDEARRCAIAIAQRSPEAALALAQCIGPSEELATTVIHAGSVEYIARYLKAIAPFRPTAAHTDAVMRRAVAVAPTMAEDIGLHPRLTYEAMSSPNLCAQTLIAASKRPDFDADSETVRMLRSIAVKDAEAAVALVRIFGIQPDMLTTIIAAPHVWPDALLALHHRGEHPDDRFIAAIIERWRQPETLAPEIADRIAAVLVALWDDVPEVVMERAVQSPHLAHAALLQIVRTQRQSTTPAERIERLLHAAARDPEVRLKTVIDFGDHPILWNANCHDAERQAEDAARSPFMHRRIIAAHAAAYLNAVVVGQHWDAIDPQRQTDILMPCLEDPQGIASAMSMIGNHPLVIHAIRSSRDRRPVEWASAWHEFAKGAPMPDDLKETLVAIAPRNPHIAVHLTRFVGWHAELLNRVAAAPYGNIADYVTALREADAWSEAVRERLKRQDDAARRLIWTMVNMASGEDVDRIVDALDDSDASIGIAISHPSFTAAYVQRHPHVQNDVVKAAALFAATTKPIPAATIDDDDLDRCADIADATPWSACILARLGIAGAGLDSLAADDEMTLLYLLRFQERLLPDERLRLLLCIGQGSADVRQAARERGLEPPLVAPSLRRR